MSSISLALNRKWRPSCLADLVGQRSAVQAFQSMAKGGNWPQALLLLGPHGVGKTSAARILARMLRCPHLREDHSPCGNCDECTSVDQGINLNVIELDGASNNSVDNIRDLIDSISYPPERGQRKVYIVDEVHMLSLSAFNAFLKTLEEPPSYVHFIFATTEESKLPKTIVSRCQRFQFHPLNQSEICLKLQKICDAEQVKYEEGALSLIAESSGGALRDAEVLLDQLAVTFSNDLKEEAVSNFLSLAPKRVVLNLFRAISLQDQKLLMSELKKVRESGYSPIICLKSFLNLCRDALFIKVSPENKSNLLSSSVEDLKTIIDKMSVSDLHIVFEVGMRGYKNLTQAYDPGLVLDILFLKLYHFHSLDQVTLHESPSKKEQKSTDTKPSSQPPSSPEEPSLKTSAAAKGVSLKGIPNVADSLNFNRATKAPSSVVSQDTWTEVLQKVAAINPVLFGKLKYASVVSFLEQELHLGLDKKLFYESLSKERVKIENIFATILGRSVTLQFSYLENGVENVDVVSLNQREEEAASKEKEEINKRVSSHPMIQVMQKHFPKGDISIKKKDD